MSAAATTIPVTILTGFLGAGKTTLLKRILDDPQGVRYGVLVNDFGAINIDAELIVESSGERVSLENGCVCCTIRDDLVDAIRTLAGSVPPPERIIIEASGVSRPLPIADSLSAEAISAAVALDAIFCLIDGDGFRDLDFAATELALEQAAGADMVILNKVDLATPAQLDAIETTLRGPLPRLRLIRATQADLPRELLFGADLRSEATVGETLPHTEALREENVHHHDHHHHNEHDHLEHGHEAGHDHGDEFEAWHWSSDGSVDETALKAAISEMPAGLMRAKGVLRLNGTPDERLVFQRVGKRTQLTREATSAPATSLLVAIGRRGSFDGAALTERFDACVAAD